MTDAESPDAGDAIAVVGMAAGSPAPRTSTNTGRTWSAASSR